jgi:hypothetical protein
VLNRDAIAARLLAKCAHENLRRESRASADLLDHVVHLYGYLSDKDVFEMLYQTHLMNRLLADECESDHKEKDMVRMFKAECGYQWTHKLEGEAAHTRLCARARACCDSAAGRRHVQGHSALQRPHSRVPKDADLQEHSIRA